MPTKSISFRVDEGLLSELDALGGRLRKDRSAVLVELVRIGLDAKRGVAEDPAAAALAELAGEVRKLRARVKKGSQAGELASVLDEVAQRLCDVMTEQQARATELITREIATLRQHVRRSFGHYLQLGFKVSDEKAKEYVKRAFDE